ncbi:CsxC family protein [Falsibacillus pallidus]|uniref:DUF7852 domain-containing protein n=1 Tax=Falsibacillus pallidus TaxID=493781 RepID=A0A370G407_9BACI|nr:hypothetical protein [Falsibacillus pallidus]RDI38518.1 hypothetical protein DFR59_11761 [Falsibacillus pallidus]
MTNAKRVSGQGSSRDPIVVPCQVDARQQAYLTNQAIPLVTQAATPTLKVPVAVAERTIQVVTEADIPLNPPATEIKRVLKDVLLTQCKLIPVEFQPIPGTDFRFVTRAKLFVEGYIRKNIEYASDSCNGVLYDRVANLHFSGFTELTAGDFTSFPIWSSSTEDRARFINPNNGDFPRLDKYYFENTNYYNEQPYCELVRADFYEIDFSPTMVDPQAAFDTLREKIVLDLSLKVLQVQQVQVDGSLVIPGNGTDGAAGTQA